MLYGFPAKLAEPSWYMTCGIGSGRRSFFLSPFSHVDYWVQ